MGIAPKMIPIPKWGIFLITLANSIAQRQKPTRIWWPKITLTAYDNFETLNELGCRPDSSSSSVMSLEKSIRIIESDSIGLWTQFVKILESQCRVGRVFVELEFWFSRKTAFSYVDQSFENHGPY